MSMSLNMMVIFVHLLYLKYYMVPRINFKSSELNYLFENFLYFPIFFFLANANFLNIFASYKRKIPVSVNISITLFFNILFIFIINNLFWVDKNALQLIVVDKIIKFMGILIIPQLIGTTLFFRKLYNNLKIRYLLILLYGIYIFVFFKYYIST